MWKHSYTIFRVFCSSEAFVWRARRAFAQCFFKKRDVFSKHYTVTCTFYRFDILWREKINLLSKSNGNLSLKKIFDFAIKWVCYKWRNCFSAKSFTNREFLPVRYMDVRFILEDIKICYSVNILLLANVVFVIVFSKTCIILAKFIYIASFFQLF